MRVKSKKASALRKARYELIRRLSVPSSTLPGSLVSQIKKCGKPNCRCAKEGGHPGHLLVFAHEGKTYTIHIKKHELLWIKKILNQTKEYEKRWKKIKMIDLELWKLQRVFLKKK